MHISYSVQNAVDSYLRIVSIDRDINMQVGEIEIFLFRHV